MPREIECPLLAESKRSSQAKKGASFETLFEDLKQS